MNEIIYISGNCKSSKIADHIQEITGLVVICDYGFKENIAKIRLNADAAEESNKNI